MANDALAIMVGVAFAAIFAVGTFIYESLKSRREEEQYDAMFKTRQPREGPSSPRETCMKCEFFTAGRKLSNLPCGHRFHQSCIIWDTKCPYPRCEGRIPRNQQSPSASTEPPRNTSGQDGVNCDYCHSSINNREVKRLPCRHIVHADCIPETSICPCTGCGRTNPNQWSPHWSDENCHHCHSSLRNRDITRLNCHHIVHIDCIPETFICPCLGCGREIPRNHHSPPVNVSTQERAPGQIGDYCGHCNRSINNKCLRRLDCGHFVHVNCFKEKSQCSVNGCY